MSITTIRSTRLARLLVALAAATSMSAGAGALVTDDAHAMRCELRDTSTQRACADGTPNEYGDSWRP